jgi:hypothetical protein
MNLKSFTSLMNCSLFLPLLLAYISGAALATDVKVSSSCIETDGNKNNNDDFQISFTIDNPKSGDWIGLFPSGVIQDSKHAPEPKDHRWIRTCGSQKCKSSPSEGKVQLRRPNKEGKWVVALARKENSAPYRIAAKTSFLVEKSCPSSKVSYQNSLLT